MEGLERNEVHQSLLRTPLFAGVDFGILIMEIALGIAIMFVGGFKLVAAVPAVLVIVAVHLPVKNLLRADPAMIAIVPAALRYRNFYPPTGGVRSEGKPKPTKSISTSV